MKHVDAREVVRIVKLYHTGLTLLRLGNGSKTYLYVLGGVCTESILGHVSAYVEIVVVRLKAKGRR